MTKSANSTICETSNGFVQSFRCLSLTDGDAALNPALARVAQGIKLNDVYIIEESPTTFTVTFVWANAQFMTEAVDEELSNRTHINPGTMKACYPEYIKQVFFHCQFQHPHICKVLGLSFVRYSELMIIIAFESSPALMWFDAQRIEELVMLRALEHIISGMLHAKSQVFCIQGFAHNYTFLSCDSIQYCLRSRVFQVANFRMKGTMSDKSDTADFQRDVYALGEFVQRAFPYDTSQSSTDGFSNAWFSKKLRRLVQALVSPDPDSRPSLEELAHRVRELLADSSILATANAPWRALFFSVPEKRNYWDLSIRLRTAWEQSPTVAGTLQLGEVLCLHLSQFDEAMAVLESSLRFATTAKEDMSLRIAIVAVNFYRANYIAAEESSLALLTAFPEGLDDDEKYWELAFYWIYSHRRVGFNVAPRRVTQLLKQRHFAHNTQNGRIYRTFVKYYETMSLPRSYWLSKKILTLCLNENPPLILISRALQIGSEIHLNLFGPLLHVCRAVLSAHFPTSTLYLIAHSGNIKSVHLVEKLYPYTIEAIHVYLEMCKKREAEGKLSEAYDYCKRLCPISLRFKRHRDLCYYNFGLDPDKEHKIALNELVDIRHGHAIGRIGWHAMESIRVCLYDIFVKRSRRLRLQICKAYG